MLISITDYAKKNGKDESVVRRHCRAGRFKTAQKIGRNWVIDDGEEYKLEPKPSDFKVYWKVKIAVFGGNQTELYFRTKDDAERFYHNTPNPADAPYHISVKDPETIRQIEETISYQGNDS